MLFFIIDQTPFKMAHFHQQRKLREPERKSILQVVQRSFSYYDRNTFLHRFIYVGKIPTVGIDPETIIRCFEKSIKPINNRYCDETISGFLLYFGNCFCHVLESSEESLVRHLCLLQQNEIIKEYFDKFKLIIVYHHMNQRFLEEWVPINIENRPISILKPSDKIVSLENTILKVKGLIEKVYIIGNSLKGKVEESVAKMRASRQRARSKSPSSYAKIAIDTNLLPGDEELEFLINSSYTKPVSVYLNVYNTVPHINEDNFWPIQKEWIPKHMFETPVNPVEDLPITNID